MDEALFFIAAFGALAGALGVVVFENPFFSVLALVGHLIALAVLFLLLSAEFVAAAQVVVYAGAVMVLYVFVVSYVGEQETLLGRPGRASRWLAGLFGACLLGELWIAFLGAGVSMIDTDGARIAPGFGSPEQIGELLLNDFLLHFEVASILLLVAAVGAVVLARRRGGASPGGVAGFDGREISVMELMRADGIGSMAESASGRRGTPIGDPTALPPGVEPPVDRERGGW